MKTSFIYIASLRRTGSTVLSEALTSLPERFIFREPKLAKNRFTAKKSDIELLRKYGIDLQPFVDRWSKKSPIQRWVKHGKLISKFKSEIMPQLLAVISQIGVKEIHHSNWKAYYSHFPDMKIILTARDPRDIYISVYNRAIKGIGTFKSGLSAKQLARDLNREFKCQLQMFDTGSSMKVRYEDFCLDKTILSNILSFVGDQSNAIGDIGAFNALNPIRQEEYKLHGNKISDIRVNRWQHESDLEVVANAQKVFTLMPEYTEFWGYRRD